MIAVILVIIYHFFPEILPGGFIGVDVFFVISGFLITSILLKDIERGTFSFKKFYGRRILRIVPPLAVVLAVILILGWFVLVDYEYSQLGFHTVAGATFTANFAFWAESGYFDTASELKPLLHLWSLGIEWQFYMLWPIIVLAVSRREKQALPIILFLTIASFVISVTLANQFSSAAYYNPVARFWELFMGGILAYLYKIPKIYPQLNTSPLSFFTKQPNSKQSSWFEELLVFAGISGIIAAAFFINDATPFPGWAALVPTTGSLLIIHAGKRSIIAQKLLAHPASVFVGTISYSLYLWHWPLLSFAKITNLPIHSTSGKNLLYGGLIALAFLLSYATYRWVETPVRNFSRNSNHPHKMVLRLSTAAVVVSIAGLGVNYGLVAPRLDDFAISTAVNDTTQTKLTNIPGSVAETVLFLGDSYVAQFYPRLEYLAEQHPDEIKSIAFRTANGCAPIPGIERLSLNCVEKIEAGFAYAESEEVSTVIVGGSWLGMVNRGDYYDTSDAQKTPIDFYHPDSDQFFADLQTRLQALQKSGKQVYLILNPPGGPAANPMMIGNRFTAAAPEVKTQSLREHLERTSWMNQKILAVGTGAGAQIMDPTAWLCDEFECYFSDTAGTPYFRDSTHMRASYVRSCLTAFDHLVLLNHQNQNQIHTPQCSLTLN